ncbi:MAG TPA: 2-oxoacid:ferredoxin oxidoreductase subunit gamma [bacterium (Candidatus Stahlbacteria)]|nr:2-oxoacid:ferredoxin oxidoreductase subunit gamma [Candidatus Stahlbacteria bacterium]
MTDEIIIAGFGGQGIVSSGMIIAQAGMSEGKYVTFFPSYGAEMRGGTANCSVVVSDDEVASPVVDRPDIVLVMNEPSLLRFEPRLKSEGHLFFNQTLIRSRPKRKDIRIFPVEANRIAEELGSGRIANMVMLGAFAAVTRTVGLESLKVAQRVIFKKADARMHELNDRGLERGAQLIDV